MRIFRKPIPVTPTPTRRTLRRTGLAAVAAAVALTLAACTGPVDTGTTPDGEPDTEAVLRYGSSLVAQSLNPVENATGAQILLTTWPVYDRLLQVTADVEYAPMLATDWTFSEDGTSITLTLRDDVTFTDGEAFNAEAVKATLDYYRAATDTQIARATALIANVEVVSEFEVTLELTKPTTSILTTLSSALGGAMISPASLDAGLTTSAVGTGAYVLDSFTPGQSVSFDRRTDEGGIWDEGTGLPARIEITTYSAQSAADNALRGGQADVITWGGDPAPYQADIDAGTIASYWHPNDLGGLGIYFNPKIAPLDDVDVRQAINFAIDRESIVNAFYPSSAPLVQPWPNGLPGYDAAVEDTYAFDPDKARDLLADAGFEDGVDIGEVLVAQAGAFQKVAEALQANLADVGITMTLRPIELLQAGPEYSKGANPALVMAMTTTSIDASEWAGRLFTNPLWNPAGASPELLKLLVGVDDPTLTEEQRAEKMAEAVAYATDEAIMAPILQGQGGQLASPKVQGLDELPLYGSASDARYLFLTK